MKNLIVITLALLALPAAIPPILAQTYNIDWFRGDGGGGISTGRFYSVNGASGTNPGIAVHQHGAFADGQNVALSAHAYVLVDASSYPIKPGYPLTSRTPPAMP